MLHTKPHGHWPFGSGEDFWRVLTIYRCGGHLGHVTQTLQTNFRCPIPLRFHMKFDFDRPSGLEKISENGGQPMDGRTDNGPWLYYKLTNKPKGSAELKTHNNALELVNNNVNIPQTVELIRWLFGKMILMSTHNICFYGELMKIIIITLIWAASRDNLSSGFSTR